MFYPFDNYVPIKSAENLSKCKMSEIEIQLENLKTTFVPVVFLGIINKNMESYFVEMPSKLYWAAYRKQYSIIPKYLNHKAV